MMPMVFIPKSAMVLRKPGGNRVVQVSKGLSRNETVSTAHSQNPLQTALHPQQQASSQEPSTGGVGTEAQDLQIEGGRRGEGLVPSLLSTGPAPGRLPFPYLPSGREGPSAHG